MNNTLLGIPRRKTRYKQGFFKPSNPQKYIGDHRNIVYRSGWEGRFMVWCDKNPNVMSWSSEETIIPYLSPVDNKRHRYFVDFRIKVNSKQGPRTILVEIKPEKETKQPETNKKGRFNEKAIVTYMTNMAKWKAAREFCEPRGMQFMILTEKDLFEKKG